MLEQWLFAVQVAVCGAGVVLPKLSNCVFASKSSSPNTSSRHSDNYQGMMQDFSLGGVRGIPASDSISGQDIAICIVCFSLLVVFVFGYFNDNVPIAFHMLRNYAVADIKVVWSFGWHTNEFESKYLQVSNVIEICK